MVKKLVNQCIVNTLLFVLYAMVIYKFSRLLFWCLRKIENEHVVVTMNTWMVIMIEMGKERENMGHGGKLGY